MTCRIAPTGALDHEVMVYVFPDMNAQTWLTVVRL